MQLKEICRLKNTLGFPTNFTISLTHAKNNLQVCHAFCIRTTTSTRDKSLFGISLSGLDILHLKSKDKVSYCKNLMKTPSPL